MTLTKETHPNPNILRYHLRDEKVYTKEISPYAGDAIDLEQQAIRNLARHYYEETVKPKLFDSLFEIKYQLLSKNEFQLVDMLEAFIEANSFNNFVDDKIRRL